MTPIVLYLTTFAIFLLLDFFGLTYLIKPLFERDIGPLMKDGFRILPAFLFYAFYIFVLLWFVSVPAMARSLGQDSPFALYRRLDRILKALRDRLREFGIDDANA